MARAAPFVFVYAHARVAGIACVIGAVAIASFLFVLRVDYAELVSVFGEQH